MKLLSRSVRGVGFSLIQCAFLLSVFGCSSSPEKKEAPDSELSDESDNDGASSAKSKAGERKAPPQAKITGKQTIVTLTLGNEEALEGSLSQSTLSQVAMSLDELYRKDPENVPLAVTYLGILRLYGNNPQLYKSVEAQAGLNGSKNVWFLLEAGYGALKENRFSFADYLFAKAKKVAKPGIEQNAITHAVGIKLLLMKKTSAGVFRMKQAAQANPPFLPAALTIGFLALRSGDYVGAERMFRSVTQSHPESVNGRLGLAVSLRAQGRAEEAHPILQTVHKQHPKDRRVAWNYALALSEQGSTQQEAIGILNRYFEMPGQYADIDSKASALLTRLNRPAAVPAANPSPAGAAAPKVP